MKKTLLIACLLFSIFGCNDDDKEQAPSKTEPLTGGNHKSWYVFSSAPDEPCPSGSDDTWTFFADGTFAYDHGTVVESEENLCGDLVNLEGTWEFSEEETKITVIALRSAGSTTDFDQPFTVGSGAITSLTADRLVITSDDESIVEFRTR